MALWNNGKSLDLILNKYRLLLDSFEQKNVMIQVIFLKGHSDCCNEYRLYRAKGENRKFS